MYSSQKTFNCLRRDTENSNVNNQSETQKQARKTQFKVVICKGKNPSHLTRILVKLSPLHREE